MTQQSIEPRWLTLARGQLGVREAPGAYNNQSVVQYYAEAAHPEVKADSVPWCAAFVGSMLKRAGFKPSGSLAARSYEQWGQPLDAPALGCVGVMKRGTGWQGHVGFVVAAGGGRVWLLGGNQGDAVSVASFPRGAFTAFRWPANVPAPRAGTLPASAVAGQGNKVS